jgi:hypothetical protein
MPLDKTAISTRRYADMQSPIRALLYGIAVWFVWVSMVAASAQILPPEISGSPLFVTLQMVALATLVLGSTILYLRKVGDGTFEEGLLVGLSWVIIMIGLDLAHAVVMPEMVPPSIGAYFATAAPSYVVVPIITTLTIGYLEWRSLIQKS